MNTQIYKQVHTLAEGLLKADQKHDDERFMQLYGELKALCYAHESDVQKNHPVQWETLADFTEDSVDALALYRRALGHAKTIESNDYLASINYAMAILLSEDKSLDKGGDKALAAAQFASGYAAKIEDAELQREIAVLLKKLTKA